jgi:hypothetical protein
VFKVLRSSPYKIRRKGEKLPGGKQNLAEELGTLEVFKLRKVTEGSLCKTLQGVQKEFQEQSKSQKGNCAKFAKDSRT